MLFRITKGVMQYALPLEELPVLSEREGALMRELLYRFIMGLALLIRPSKSCAVASKRLKRAVLAYQHPDLIERLIQKFELTRDQAEDAFMGMKQYLYLAGTRGGGLSPQSEIVDEAWHNFMLFSLDYQKFCMGYFGRFIHHQPFNAAKRAASNGQGSRNTKLGLEEEFGVVLAGAGASAGRCDACVGDGCACSDRAPADSKVMTSDCISVPDGGYSGSTNCQNLAPHKLVHAGVACDPCCSGSQCCSDHS